MKAIVYGEYGSPDVLRFRDVDIPAMQEHEVLVEVRAASPNPWDWHFMRGEPYVVRLISGLRRPKPGSVIGSDMAGQVVAVGKGVTRFEPGDEVFGFVGHGGFAEQVTANEEVLGFKPRSLSFEQAAAVPLAALTALQGLRDAGRLAPGQRVLINGASGGVGTFAVQIAKALGAEVTAVCSTQNMDLVASIGADHVIDYTTEDVLGSGLVFDVVMDNAGNHRLSDWRRLLSPDGVFVAVAGLEPMGLWFGPFAHRLKVRLAALVGSQRFTAFLAKPTIEDMLFLHDLLETERMVPVIDRTYPLSAAADAIAYLEYGHVRGKLVITV
jgi:NADPH:quinone reductase-like Zn-dependent oxidoreductase